MPLSRSARIKLLLVIDVFFFFVEIITGYAVGSLALVADSFHMLNDVMSLIVALYAIKLTQQTTNSSRYSYGWHRAEILAALVNGVFLLALCFSIFMEAIQRFFVTPEISNPRLVVFVGSLGLASNIVGLFLFHEHDHSHDHQKTSRAPSPHPTSTPSPSAAHGSTSPPQIARNGSNGRPRADSYSSLYGHPAATRASLVQAAQDLTSGRPSSPTRRGRGDSVHQRIIEETSSGDVIGTKGPDEDTPLLSGEIIENENNGASVGSGTPVSVRNHGHQHSGSMNMRALVLHVLGDALGNVGVIATGLIIWYTTWSFKYYFDPLISLVITVIIFSSAMPLVRSTSTILLQGVPHTISLEDVRESILNVEGVLSVHELHIWQLSESKIVGSVHVMASRNHDFMPVAAEIRKALHYHGIHSTTIQPEYHPRSPSIIPEAHLRSSTDSSCLILCPPDQNCDPLENSCCPPPPPEA
ncbi:hypothetical protein SERLA73DRAFT_97348 [Serpula lacrymans var. lacrymans S7.3]|uniref:Cation efflux protein n=2 Tax=Serpula lacrymans var. lacrymans TaxID=341189 RepID=F8QCT9_SERL3|nr:uncharacterized protein SERLADRAFT_453786 [Serpula lacrymans var. lacrymans S7.9]EGN93954.1 hypothetical protein SERLA73DRAFT_97348 [Serpula lacrymans var. lacrymans S7.3]EGO19320.1 hypothetical protein SERLADRAFT_453786 [Serpula lacrymans var. lacrymans S7.9]